MKKFTAHGWAFAGILGACVLIGSPVQGQTGSPVQHQTICSIPAGQAICSAQVAVPAGKQFTIEFVSARVVIPSGQVPQLRIFTPSANLSGGTSNVGHYIALGLAGGSGTTDQLYASQPVRLYVMPGGTITVHTSRNTSTGTATFEVTLSGNIVDVP